MSKDKITEDIARIIDIKAKDIIVHVNEGGWWSGTIGANGPCAILQALLIMDAKHPGDAEMKILSIHTYGTDRLLVRFNIGGHRVKPSAWSVKPPIWSEGVSAWRIELSAVDEYTFAKLRAGKTMMC